MTLTQIVKRIDYWQHHPSLAHLGLAHWRFTVKWYDASHEGDNKMMSDAVATVNPSTFYTDATITLSEADIASPAYEGDEDRYIVHELLHVAMRDLDEAMEADIEEFFPPPLVDTHEHRVRHAKEGLIDALARVIVSLDRKAN